MFQGWSNKLKIIKLGSMPFTEIVNLKKKVGACIGVYLRVITVTCSCMPGGLCTGLTKSISSVKVPIVLIAVYRPGVTESCTDDY